MIAPVLRSAPLRDEGHGVTGQPNHEAMPVQAARPMMAPVSDVAPAARTAAHVQSLELAGFRRVGIDGAWIGCEPAGATVRVSLSTPARKPGPTAPPGTGNGGGNGMGTRP